MSIFHWFLLGLSALLYALPFIFSAQLWWMVFVMPIPLLYLAVQENLSFKHGFFWGVIVWGLHLTGVLLAIINMAQGPWFFNAIPSITIVSLEAVLTGIIFFVAHKTGTVLRVHNQVQKLIMWTAVFFVFIVFADWYCLSLFVRWEGTFFMHPLLPLAQKPHLLAWLTYLGKQGLTVLLLMVPMSLTSLIIWKNRYALLFTVLAITPWVIMYYRPVTTISPPSWLARIFPLPITFSSEFNLTHMAQNAGKRFKAMIDRNPSTQLIVMPESSYYCRHLSKNPDLASLWSEEHMGKKIHLVLGAFRWENDKHYNSLHWIYDGKMQTYCDKRHTMVLVEQMPNWFNIAPVRSLYFSTFPEITPSKQPRPLLHIFDETPFVPYICSELFFNEWPDDSYSGVPILIISNDSWFAYPHRVPYMQELMYLAARFKAIQWQRDIVYIAFSRSGYIDLHGNEIRAR